MPRKIERPIVAGFGLAVAGILAALALVEVWLRASGSIPEVANPLYSLHESDPRLGWRGRPRVHMRFRRPDFDALVVHGPDGFRSPQPPPPPHPARRVLFLGDSFTWGWGVSQGELFTDRLESTVAPRLAIVNRGVNAFGTAQEYLLMQDELAETPYDTVVLVFVPNDVRDNVDPKSGRRPFFVLEGHRLVLRNQPARRLMSPWMRFTKDNWRGFQLLDFAIGRLRQREATPHIERDAETPNDYHDLPGAAVTIRLVAEMQKLAQAHGSRFVVVYVPQRSEFEPPATPGSAVRALHALARDASRRVGVPLIDLTAAFAERAARGERLVFPTDAHWTAAGHQLTADVLLAAGVL